MDTATKAGKGPSKAYATALALSDSEEEEFEALDLGPFFDEHKVPYPRQLQIVTGYATHLRALMNVNKGKTKKKRAAEEENNE